MGAGASSAFASAEPSPSGALADSSQLRLADACGLHPHDFSAFGLQKLAAYLPGTREWAFSEIAAWLDAPDAPQLFWLMGGGGTGKSVVTAELVRRTFDRVAAWHFCRHDSREQSVPASLLQSLAAMLCSRLPGYADALGEVPPHLLVSTDPEELFASLFQAPLQKVHAPERALLLVIDALDEIPREAQAPLLGVIASQLSKLPRWLRLFVTSREEPQIKAALRTFKPKELRADEARNRADVRIYLRQIAGAHVKGQANMADIEADAKRTLGVDVVGKLVELQAPLEESREIYLQARTSAAALDSFEEMLQVDEERPDARQVSNVFETVYAQAAEAQQILTSRIATEWAVDPNKATLRHPVPGAAVVEWLEEADDPGVKGEPRSREKVRNDYGGHANALKDLARLTLRFRSPRKLLLALEW